MRSLKKMIAITLVLTAMLLTGCQNQDVPETTTQSVERLLAGTWTTVLDRSQEQARTLLENIHLYDEEFALVDLSSLHYTKTVTFDGSYYIFAYDADACRQNVRDFYEGLFDALYENRVTLNTVYHREFDNMSLEEFHAFYVQLYGKTSYSEMISGFTAAAYDYDALGILEKGFFSVKDDKLWCIPNENATNQGMVGYSLEGDTLTLTFSNAIEIYTK